jgi:hypothetical protein
VKKTDIFPSNYVKAADIEGREVTVVISDAKMEKLGDDNKLVVYFQGATKGMVCNMTNFDRIAYIAGSDDTDDWQGREIILYTELVAFQGKTAPAVRVRAPLKKQNGGTHELEDKGRYDTLRKTEPIKTAGDDLPTDESIPF